MIPNNIEFLVGYKKKIFWTVKFGKFQARTKFDIGLKLDRIK